MSQIAKDFGISASCLHRWLKLAGVDDGGRPGVTSSESAELRELRRRNKTLEQENEILRRVAAFFAREIAPKMEPALSCSARTLLARALSLMRWSGTSPGRSASCAMRGVPVRCGTWAQSPVTPRPWASRRQVASAAP